MTATKRALLCVLVGFGACGPKPAPTWIEHEGSQTHARNPNEVTPPPSGGRPDARAVDLAKLSPATIDELDEATARAVVERLENAAPAAAVAMRAARLAHHRGDDATARDDLAHASTAADAAILKAPIAELAGELADTAVHPERVAVLLPLTGKYGAVGAELRAAIELAPAQGTRWLFLDTKGDPAGAIAAVDAAAKQGAIAILGPVGAREITAASRAAALHAIPIALLGPEDGADPAAGVFRLVGSPADEGRAVAQLAKTNNFGTVAVFAPRDDIGAEASEAFTTAAVQLGLQVVKQGSYDPTGGDVEPDVKQFLDLVPARNPELAEHLRRAKTTKLGWETFSPDITYSLLYIPDRYDRAAIVSRLSCRTTTSSSARPSSPTSACSARSTAVTFPPSSSSSGEQDGITHRCRSVVVRPCKVRCSSTAFPGTSVPTSPLRSPPTSRNARNARQPRPPPKPSTLRP